MSAAPNAAIVASDPALSAWVNANAGSGKTYVLTARVIRLLLDGTPPDRLLCLTYTRAAAAEMRARVFKRLADWTKWDDARLAADIAEIEGRAPDRTRMDRARQLFATALETPGGLKVQTIHAFCERLIGRFPAEADAPVPFSVLTEAEAAALKREARIHALERLDSEATQRAMTMLAAHLDAGRFTALIDGPAAKVVDEATIDAWAAQGLPHGLTPEDVIAEAGFDAPERLQLYRAAAELFARGKQTDVKIGAALAEGCVAELDARFGLLVGAFHTEKGTRRATIGTKDLRLQNAAFFADFDAEIERACGLLARLKAAEAAVIVEAVATLARAARAEYRAMKRQRGKLDFDDLITTALKLLSTSSSAAWVLYKLDGGLDHILIDEAQDTSPGQWAVVERLAEEFFAGAGRDTKKKVIRTLFAVGDDKQSIYSFQGADPKAFDAFREFFQARIEKALGKKAFVATTLSTSRRSAPEVLALVDAVFAAPELRAAASRQDWAHHVAHRAKAAGLVELWPLTPKAETEDRDLWTVPPDAPHEADAAVRLASRLARTIAGWIGREHIEQDGALRPMRAGDVLILVQRRGRLSQAIIRKLKQAGVPVAGADRLQLTGHIAVKDLIAVGRAALLPQDDLNMAALLKSPFFGVTEDQLFELAHKREGSLWRALRVKAEAGAPWREVFDRLSAMINRLGRDAPFDFYARLLSSGEGRARLMARLGEEAEDVIDEFLAQAAAYEENEAPSLEGFLHWLEMTGAEVKRDPDEAGGAVRVLTVHGAKGLEAPVVILPDTMSVPSATHAPQLMAQDGSLVWLPSGTAAADTAKAAWMAAQLAEHVRLLYVALTRPRDRLIVCGIELGRKASAPTWYEAISAGFERLEGVEAIAGDDGVVLRYGKAVSDAAPELALSGGGASPLPDWTRVAARREATVGIVRPSRLEPQLTFGDVADAHGLERGRVLHLLLQRLPEIAPAARQAAGERFLALRAADWPDKERKRALAQALEVIADPRFAAAFAPGSLAEAPIAGRVAALGALGFISGRIDRLSVGDDGVLIVDYKTNRKVPAGPEATPAAYVKQMALYREAMRAAFPGRPVRVALLWTEGPALHELPDSLLDAALSGLAAA